MELSFWQRIKRRLSLLGGSYKHPDGYIELDFDEKAGIDRFDSDEVQEEKLDRYNQKQGIRETRTIWFFFGGVTGVLLCRFFDVCR